MWVRYFIDAIKVSLRRISFAFNLGQICALIAGRRAYDCEPLQLEPALLSDTDYL